MSEKVSQILIYEYINVSHITFEHARNYEKHKHTILICPIFHCYEHAKPKIENVFLSSLISLRKGFVLGTNLWISILKKSEMDCLCSILNGQ